MKKYNILFIAFIIVLFCSCNDFLDNNPEGEYEKESLDYSKIENMFNPFQEFMLLHVPIMVLADGLCMVLLLSEVPI